MAALTLGAFIMHWRAVDVWIYVRKDIIRSATHLTYHTARDRIMGRRPAIPDPPPRRP